MVRLSKTGFPLDKCQNTDLDRKSKYWVGHANISKNSFPVQIHHCYWCIPASSCGFESYSVIVICARRIARFANVLNLEDKHHPIQASQSIVKIQNTAAGNRTKYWFGQKDQNTDGQKYWWWDYQRLGFLWTSVSKYWFGQKVKILSWTCQHQ